MNEYDRGNSFVIGSEPSLELFKFAVLLFGLPEPIPVFIADEISLAFLVRLFVSFGLLRLTDFLPLTGAAHLIIIFP